jgi:hypothetical protein
MLRTLLTAAYTLGFAAIGAGLGYASGGDSAERERRAGIGALVGGSFGLFRGLTEAGIGLWRTYGGASRAVQQPIIVYYEAQRLGPFATGRMGAELIAEANRIPRSRWNTHLISRQRVLAGTAQWPVPAQFNGQLIAVGHGHLTSVRAELGVIQPYQFIKTDGTTGLRRAWVSGDELSAFVPANLNVTRVDLSVCYGQRNFAGAVGAAFTARNNGVPVPVTASMGTVTPLGPWHYSGRVRPLGEEANGVEMFLGIPFTRIQVF